MIVITAPTGNIGSQVLQHLLKGGEPLRLIVRDPTKLAPEVLKHAEVIQGSHSELDVLNRAFKGARSVFWLVASDPQAVSARASYVDFSRPASQALKECGVKQVVAISALGRGWPKESGYVTATLEADDLLAKSGVAFRALACGSLMENFLRQVPSINEQGVFYATGPADMKAPACATRDVAAFAAKLLLDSSWSGVDSVPMIGPADVSNEEVAQTISEVLSKPIGFRELPVDALKVMMLKRGASQGMAQAMADMMTAKNEGMDNVVKRTQALSDLNPTSFRQWCEDVLKPALMKQRA